jgi:TatD DNase family protein
MILTDTHTHLYADQFNEDREAMLQRAFNNGIERIFLPNIDRSSIEGMLKMQTQYPKNCFPMMGLHPCSVDGEVEKELALVKEWLDKGGFCAVGEIGIDLYWDKTFFKQQQHAFRQQINWAKEMGLPIVIHARDSFDEIFKIVDELNDERLTGIFHCFTGTIEQAEKIINYGGFKMGIGGVVTFKNAGVDKVVQQIDLKHLVLETDSPYLAPAPNRGKRNETSYLLNIADKISDLHEISVAEVARITTENSKEVFGI